MDNFDKLFQEKLGEIKETDFVFKASAWANFQKKWHQDNTDDEIAAPFLWRRRHFFSVAALALLLCGNAFFATQTFKSQTQIESLAQKVETLEQEVAACAERQKTNDADFSTSDKTILNQNKAFANQNQNRAFANSNNNLSDNGSTNNAFANQNQNTAFANSNNNLNDNGSANNAFANQNQNNGFANSNNNSGDNGSANNAFANENQNNAFANAQEDSATTVAANKIAEDVLKLSLASVAAPLSPPPFGSSPTLPARKPTFGEHVIKLQQAATPSGFRVGLTSQVALLPFTQKNVAPVLMQQHGISADALFFDRLRLKVGANYWQQVYDIDDIERRPDGVLFPILANLPRALPRQDDDVFTRFEARVFGVDVPLTLQLLLAPQKRFSPYLGVGVVGRYYHRYEAEFYFLENTIPYERYEIKSKRPKEQWNFGIWQGQFGFDYRLTERWGLNFELNYLQSHQTQPFGRTDMRQFGSSLGVHFKF